MPAAGGGFFRCGGFCGFGQCGRFQCRQPRFQFRQLDAGFQQYLLLDVKFFARHQVHFAKRAAQHGFGVFLEILGGAVGDGVADFTGGFFKKLFGNHGLVLLLGEREAAL